MKIHVPSPQAEKWLAENPVILAEQSPNISPNPAMSRGDWLDILGKLAPWERQNPTRQQFAAALRERWPSAAVYVGGHHVAVHFAGSLERHLMFTCSSVPDWN